MSKPAARVGDMHTCPMVTPGLPPIPHVGGAVMPPGKPMVIIGGQPAAVMTDMCICVSPAPDVINKGSIGVLIGGQPVARMGDTTAHGGIIIMGYPTVLVGDLTGADLITALNNVLREINASNSTLNCGNIIDAVAAFLRGQGINRVSAGGDGTFDQINARLRTNIDFNNSTNFNSIYQDLHNRGPGSVTVIGVDYNNGGSHVIVAANVDGQVGIMEGQNWGTGRPAGFITNPATANARYNPGGASTIAASPIP